MLTKNGGGDHKRRLSRVHYNCKMHCVQCTLEKQCTAHHVIIAYKNFYRLKANLVRMQAHSLWKLLCLIIPWFILKDTYDKDSSFGPIITVDCAQGPIHCFFTRNLMEISLHCISFSVNQIATILALTSHKSIPDSKVQLAPMGPTWVLSAPGEPHVGPMNLATWDIL